MTQHEMEAFVPRCAAAIAHPNIALVKYWGKRALAGNLPAVGSLSITLDTLLTRTQVRFDPTAPVDCLFLNGSCAPAAIAQRTTDFLDLVRQRAGVHWRAVVHSENNFPTGAGLASSAAAFAALALAASAAMGFTLAPRDLSTLARQGSGSAARSVFGGFVQMHRGVQDSGHDSYAEPLLTAAAWPLCVVVAITCYAGKAVGSTAGMEVSRQTAPYYQAWVDSAPADLQAARLAVQKRDFTALAEVAEHSCLKMHALALASVPPLFYWNPATLAAMHTLRELRREGVPVFFTVDAGPQVKAVCLPEAAGVVRTALQAVDGVQAVVQASLGGGARQVPPWEAAL